MRKDSRTLDTLLQQFPEQHDYLRSCVDRAKSLYSECGCAAGGVGFIGAVALLLIYGISFHGFANHALPAIVVGVVLCAFCVSVAAKLVAIGVARLRLWLLYRRLRRQFIIKEE